MAKITKEEYVLCIPRFLRTRDVEAGINAMWNHTCLFFQVWRKPDKNLHVLLRQGKDMINRAIHFKFILKKLLDRPFADALSLPGPLLKSLRVAFMDRNNRHGMGRNDGWHRQLYKVVCVASYSAATRIFIKRYVLITFS